MNTLTPNSTPQPLQEYKQPQKPEQKSQEGHWRIGEKTKKLEFISTNEMTFRERCKAHFGIGNYSQKKIFSLLENNQLPSDQKLVKEFLSNIKQHNSSFLPRVFNFLQIGTESRINVLKDRTKNTFLQTFEVHSAPQSEPKKISAAAGLILQRTPPQEQLPSTPPTISSERNIGAMPQQNAQPLPTRNEPQVRVKTTAIFQKALPQPAKNIQPEEKAESSPHEIDEDSLSHYKDQVNNAIKNAGGTWRGFEQYWSFFSTQKEPPVKTNNIHGYNNAKQLWKVFLNPTQKNFSTVLERSIKALNQAGLNIEGKIVQDPTQKGKSGTSMLNDPCEPKLLLYVTGTNPEEAKDQLVKVMSALEKEFSAQEMEQLACGQGTRLRKDTGKEVPQWGPSFTKKHTNLIFYSQGGFEESERSKMVGNQEKLEANFEGENLYLYKGFSDPILAAKEKLVAKKEEIPAKVEGENKELPATAKTAALRLSSHIISKLERKQGDKSQLLETDYNQKCVRARIALKKTLNDPLAEIELATFLNVSIAQLRNMKIADQALKLAQQKFPSIQGKMQKDQLTKVEAFLGSPEFIKDIFKALGIDTVTGEKWLADGEIDLQKRTLLTQYGANFAEPSPPLSKDDLQKIDGLLTYLEKFPEGFSQPLTILKLYNLGIRLKKTPHQRCTKILGDLLSRMERSRQGALWELMQAKATPEELRKQAFGKIWTMAGAEEAIQTPTQISPEARLNNLLKNAKAMRDQVVKALKNPEAGYNDVMQQFPQSGVETFVMGKGMQQQKGICVRSYLEDMKAKDKSKKEILENLKAKLDNVIARQETRLKSRQIEYPVFFHATPNENTCFAVATTGVRAAQATYFGAFLSTQPAMLRYGGFIVGLPERAAFAAEKEKYLPTDDPDLNRAVFQDDKTEKWIALHDMVGVSKNHTELRGQFFESVRVSVHKMVDDYRLTHKGVTPETQALFEETMIRELQEHLINLSFEPDKADPSKGSWQVQVADKKASESTSNNPLKYGPFTNQSFQSILQSTAFDGILREMAKDFQGQSAPFEANLKENFHSLFGAEVTIDATKGVSISKGRGEIMIPFFIGMDAEPAVQDYFLSTRPWLNRVNTKEQPKTCSELQEEYKKNIGYKNLPPIQKKEADRIIETHFTPLLEQLLEFDLRQWSDQPAALVLKRWKNLT